MSRPTQTLPVYWVSRHVQTQGAPLTAEKSVQAPDFAPGRLGDRDVRSPMAVRSTGSRLRVDAHTQTRVASADVGTETGPDPVRTQLAEAMKQIQGLHLMLRDSHKVTHHFVNLYLKFDCDDYRGRGE